MILVNNVQINFANYFTFNFNLFTSEVFYMEMPLKKPLPDTNCIMLFSLKLSC